MRIILFGQAAFGAKVMERLVQAGQDIVLAVAPQGSRGEPLKDEAAKTGVPICQVATMKDTGVYPRCSELKPDLGVMAFVTDIIPLKTLNCTRLGTIQYHPSLLPKHRGGSAINWAIINGEPKTGITIFWADAGIDTGPILLQREIDILPDDTVGSLYFNKLFPQGIDLLMEAATLVELGKAPRIKQDESQATYEGLCDETVAQIDWSQPSRTVYNLIRGTNPQPGAYTCLEGNRLKIFDSVLSVDSAKEIPGKVLDISEAGIKIATADGAIVVRRVQPAKMPKAESIEYARSVNLRVGAIFGQKS